MRALKILVVVMGLMLVVGFAALVAGIAVKSSQTRLPATPLAAPAVDLPAGARIEAMAVGPDRLVLDIVLPDGDRQLRILDLASGRAVLVVPLHVPPDR